MKRIIRKLKSDAGFTLAEALLAVLILLLASSVVAAGMPAALSAYRNAIDAANAQVILSATVNALRSELTTARDVETPGGTTITYYSAQTGSKSMIYIGSDPEDSDGPPKILLQAYVDLDDDELKDLKENEEFVITAEKPAARPLVSDSMTRTTKDRRELMTVSYDKAYVIDGVVTIEGLTVIRRDEKREDAVLAKMDTDLTIRPLNQVSAVTGG